MIIGVTGTNGSGKGTVVGYLKSKGFTHYSARDFIVAEIEKRGLPINRTTMNETANGLREKHGPAFIVSTLYERAVKSGSNATIESVRNIGEAEFLKSHGAYLLAIDADRKLRYKHVIGRGSATDHVTFEEFCEQEDREMNAPEVWNMNIIGVMKLADHTIMNDGSLKELHAQVDAILETPGN